MGYVWPSLSLGSAAVFSLLGTTALAAEFPPCPPPASNEYLLLVRGDSEAEREQVQAVLPPSNSAMVCSYLNDTVVRAGGFTSLENANAWAQYMTEVEGLQAFVARPATEPVSTTTPEPEATSPDLPSYQPEPLGAGYAILVDYANQPQVATEVRSLLGQPVGLVVYQQRPYLLAQQSNDPEAATALLRRLSDAGLASFIVSGLEVMVLTSEVAIGD
ncbi:hypothetical protein [Halomicronema hongdechloris]|uniref:hypothetical protein n=1 Tax=Halomicronema hongdechloris TaxID=1209493 RepID=UPI0010CC3CF6|nr:hypothetical protein [Halomicronema hongdechloris]